MTTRLTPKQDHVLSTIKSYTRQTGKSPTLGELAHNLDVTRRAVVKHLEALEKKGLIVRTSAPRGIMLNENSYGQMFLDVSILGYANAGQPLIYADEQNLGSLRIQKSLLRATRELFAVIIKGDSMNKRSINGTVLENGNFAVITKSQEINDGDVVLAIIDNGATIKTIKHDGSMVVLYPESSNPAHMPIYLTDPSTEIICGKVIAAFSNPLATSYAA